MEEVAARLVVELGGAWSTLALGHLVDGPCTAASIHESVGDEVLCIGGLRLASTGSVRRTMLRIAMNKLCDAGTLSVCRVGAG